MSGHFDRVETGDSRAWLKRIGESTIDSCVCDPPYELTSGANGGFMGQRWDATGVAFDRELWAGVLRALKPGAILLAFGGSRTYHRMAVAIEDAGFEIIDGMMWLYGKGFPKSHDISKAIDAHIGAVRPVIGKRKVTGTARIIGGQGGATSGRAAASYAAGRVRDEIELTGPGSPEAAHWNGWGTALKPAFEPVVVARKPFAGTFAENVLAHGTGAFNIDGSRIGDEERTFVSKGIRPGSNNMVGDRFDRAEEKTVHGRWPANVLLDGEAAALLNNGVNRFFYTAKAGADERWSFCRACGIVFQQAAEDAFSDHSAHADQVVSHPTQKPLDLMQYLIRLVTQPGGVVLDPFCGTGTTAVAAKSLGFHFVTCDLSADYVKIAEARLASVGVAQGSAVAGAFFCPGCKAKGELKLIERSAVDRMRADGKKVTCPKCLKRYAYEDLSG